MYPANALIDCLTSLCLRRFNMDDPTMQQNQLHRQSRPLLKKWSRLLTIEFRLARAHRTPCARGGSRVWFRCPTTYCARLVAILYLGGSGIFACRDCYQLAYPSQRESEHDRLARQADKLRERLQWEPGMLNGSGGRPKGMHQTTFERLSNKHDVLKKQRGD